MNLPSIDRDRITEFCRKYGISRLAFFGSIARGDARPDSDADVLVTFTDPGRWSLFDLEEMENELKGILGREVDLIERQAIEKGENYILRKHVFESEVPFYVEG